MNWITKWNINSNYSEVYCKAKDMFNKIEELKGGEFAWDLLNNEEEFNRRFELYCNKQKREALRFTYKKHKPTAKRKIITVNDFINGKI
jgi:hypothetical protein